MDHFGRWSAGIVIALIVIGGGLAYWFGRPVGEQVTINAGLNANQPTANTNNANQPTQNSNTSPGTVDHISIALIKIGDNGQSGMLVGCGDSLVMVERAIAPTQAPLRAALEELLQYEPTADGQSYVNIVQRSSLGIDSVSIENGRANVALSGTLSLGGVCDDPRFQNQLESTVKQFSTVQTTNITVNGKSLAEVVSQQ